MKLQKPFMTATLLCTPRGLLGSPLMCASAQGSTRRSLQEKVTTIRSCACWRFWQKAIHRKCIDWSRRRYDEIRGIYMSEYYVQM